ncbi:MAG: TDP-N-acetylfucosamine:lipid II N-acetylfucosaminyltransferase [Gammaproteobacteria bacterium]|nr:TDP-N-acetylfucosamine:lipid II N-acetylfucosaminyltransferase [Gammaproteobacteria bacterium]MDH5799266.1 TDP-N-acetylfucosamine:lipid II N-acetylfucosaminyltransferase [Gammaproteobacteria bacterium]
MIRILHIAPDEKFIPFVQKLFDEIYPGNNRFRITLQPGKSHLKFAESNEYSNSINSHYWFSRFLRDDLNWCDCLIIHYLHFKSAVPVLLAPSRVTVIWSSWGRDYQNFLYQSERELVLDRTLTLYRQTQKSRGWFRMVQVKLRRIVRYMAYLLVLNRLLRSSVSRVDYFSSPINNDFHKLQEKLKYFKASYIQLNYGDVSVWCKGLKLSPRNDILVGNSSAPENNHVEIFSLLRNSNLMERKIIVPLVYGDSDFAKQVETLGKSIFGENFVSICKFIPLEEYNDLVSGCSVVIFNHIRQQAVGNALTAICGGARVYFNPESVVYKYFKDMGAHIYTIPEEGFNEEALAPLSQTQKEENRKVVEQYSGCTVVRNNVVKLAETVGKSSKKYKMR